MKVTVIGGGIVGLSAAWQCARRGHHVTVLDPDPGRGAASVAAGLLAAAGEARADEPELTGVLLAGASRWPGFAAELVTASGRPGTPQQVLDHRCEGTLLVAGTQADLAWLRRRAAAAADCGAVVEPVTPQGLQALEPRLSHRLAGGVLAPADHQVDPRRVTAALLDAAGAAGVRFEPREADPAELADGEPAPSDVVRVVAAGWRSPELVDVPVRPVAGQVVRLRGPQGLLRRPIRALVAERSVYLVPRADGEVLVGATEREGDTAPRVTAGGVRDLLNAAVWLVPELAEAAMVESVAGIRPVSTAGTPTVGWVRPGVLAATGHGRHGVLLAPLAGEQVADLVDARAQAGPAHHEQGHGPGPGTARRDRQEETGRVAECR